MDSYDMFVSGAGPARGIGAGRCSDGEPTVALGERQLADPGPYRGLLFGGLLLLIAGAVAVRLDVGNVVIAPVTAATIVSSGVLLALVFHPVADAPRFGRSAHTVAAPVLELRAHRPMGTQD